MFPDSAPLQNATIIGSTATGLIVKTKDGRTAKLAIVDDAGNVIDDSPDVAREAWAVVVSVYNNVLQSQGHLVVYTSPTGMQTCTHKELKKVA